MYLSFDEQYNALCEDIRANGVDKHDRTGVGSRSVFGRKMVFDIRQGRIPLLTTKKVGYRKSFEEMFWFISGTDWIDALLAQGNHIWDSWVDPETARYDEQGKLIRGRVPNVYGAQWRHWSDTRTVSSADLAYYQDELGYHVICEIPNRPDWFIVHRQIDQLASVIRALRHNPDSRRIIMTAWNVGKLDQMGLPPCHKDIQFWTRELTLDERIHAVWGDVYRPEPYQANHGFLDHHEAPRRAISAQVYLRSNDVPLGNPFNCVQYALFIHMVAHCVNMATEEFHYVIGDAHVYQPQWEALNKQLAREPIEDSDPRVVLNPGITDIDDFTIDDVQVVGYKSHGRIKFPPAAV